MFPDITSSLSSPGSLWSEGDAFVLEESNPVLSEWMHSLSIDFSAQNTPLSLSSRRISINPVDQISKSLESIAQLKNSSSSFLRRLCNLQDFPRENLEQHPLVQQQATDPMIYCPERTRVRFSSYFHANWIQDLLPDREVIVAALPTASTLNAFWQLILEQEVQVVICCSHPADCSKPALVPYWPRGNDAYRSPAAHYSLQALFKEAGPPGVSAHYLELAHEQKKSRAHVLLIHIDGWKDFVTPPAAYIEGICHFIEEKSSFYPGRILFQSQSGAGRAGTLLASWLARQKMSEQYLITKTLPDFSSDWLYDLIYPLKRDRDFRLIRTDGQLEGLLGVIELTVKNILEQVQAQQEMEEKALSTPSSPAALPNYGPGSLG